MMIKIYSAANLTEAHIVNGMLQANGIDAHVGGHYLQGGIGELAAMDFASVYIDDSERNAARQLIASYEKGSPDTDPSETDKDRGSDSSTQFLILIFCISIGAIALAVFLL